MAQQNNSFDGLVLTEVKLSNEIGAGAYGKVFQAEYYGSHCVAKEFSSTLKPALEVSTRGTQKVKENLLKKCQRILQLRHPNIVQFLGVHYKPSSPTIPLLMMEMMDSNLNLLLKDYSNIPIYAKLSVLLDVSLGLKFLHSQKPSVVHCHLSSHNILLTPSLQAKISDIGMALIIPEKSLKQFMKATWFTAPEISKTTATGGKILDPSVDIFSYGAIMLHTITQQCPEPKKQPLSKVSQYQTYIDKTLDEKELALLALQCLDDLSEKRPTIHEVLEKVAKVMNKYPFAKRNVIAWQTELQHITEQKTQLEKEMKLCKKQHMQDQQQSKDEIELLRKQVVEKSAMKHGDDADSALKRRVRELEDENENRRSEIDSFKEQVDTLHQQLQSKQQQLDARISQSSGVTKEENQSVAKLVINPEVHKSSGQIVPVTKKSNSVKESLGAVTSGEQVVNSNNPDGDSEITNVTRHAINLEKVILPYEFDKSGPKVVELSNLGNTCYLNSVLQCIHQTVGLHYAVAEGERKYMICNDEESLTATVKANNGTMTLELRKFFQNISKKKYGSVSPSDLLDALSNKNKRFGRGTEEDSHEALRYLLSALREEEIKEIEKEIAKELSSSEGVDGEVKLSIKGWESKISKGITVIDDLIGIQLVSTVVCHDCAIPIQIEDLHLDLSLPMPLKIKEEEVLLADGVNKIVKSRKELNVYLKENKYHYAHATSDDTELNTGLEQCLSEFTDLDILDEDNKFACHICNKSEVEGLQRVSRLILIHHLSPVMILQLKRFSIGSYSVAKDGEHVSFPLVLNMAPYCTSECVQKLADKNSEILYGLYAVVVHHGSSLHSGHYTAFVRQRPAIELKKQLTERFRATWMYDPNSVKIGKWYYASDSFVTSVYELSEVHRCQAYLLFYEQLPTT